MSNKTEIGDGLTVEYDAERSRVILSDGDQDIHLSPKAMSGLHLYILKQVKKHTGLEWKEFRHIMVGDEEDA